MEFVTKEVVLFKTKTKAGIKAILSERTAGNIYNLSEAVDENLSGVETLLIQCKGLEHGLTENLKEAPGYSPGDFFLFGRFLEKRTYRKEVKRWNEQFKSKYLFKHLRISQILKLTKQLVELENLGLETNGQKKTPNPSQEILQTP